MAKVVINVQFGGFGLSHAGCLRYLELARKKVWVESNAEFATLIPYTYWLVPPEERQPPPGDEWHSWSLADRQAYNARATAERFYDGDLVRDDPLLVRVVEELGDAANGSCATLKVVDVPDDATWEIDEYDGNEHIAEMHRTWR